MKRALINGLKKFFLIPIKYYVKREYSQQKFEKFNERPVEYAFVFKKLSELYPKYVLDVGTGTTALPHLMRNCGSVVFAIDNITDYWESSVLNRHYHVIDDDITKTRLTNKVDFITCISTLEHIDEFEKAVENMSGLLADKGSLILTFPFSGNEYVDNVYELPESTYDPNRPYKAHSFTQEKIINWCNSYGLRIIDQEFWQFWTGDYWTVGDKIFPPALVSIDDKYQITCIHLKKI